MSEEKQESALVELAKGQDVKSEYVKLPLDECKSVKLDDCPNDQHDELKELKELFYKRHKKDVNRMAMVLRASSVALLDEYTRSLKKKMVGE